MLLVISLELLFVAQQFGWGLLLLCWVGVALFPSNYEIRGMEDDEEAPPEGEAEASPSADAEAVGPAGYGDMP